MYHIHSSNVQPFVKEIFSWDIFYGSASLPLLEREFLPAYYPFLSNQLF
jgi:hypothetical protein